MDWKLVYLDLFRQPNFGLLERVDNGVDMVTTIQYRSPNEFIINDKLTGEPWCLAWDGYFDTTEKDFRGFAKAGRNEPLDIHHVNDLFPVFLYIFNTKLV